jgi:acetylornithine deacetylase
MPEQDDREAVTLLAELVSIDSVNPSLVPGAAGEARIVEHLSTRLERSGFATTVVMAGDRPSLVAVPPGREDARTIVLNGHLDTVGVAGMTWPFVPRVEGDRLYGRGAADMKGGVAAMVVAAERSVALGLPVRPVLALVADEEDASLGSEAVIAALPELGVRPETCVIGEPTDLALSRSLRGFGVARVTLTGRASHSSQPELGVNAVTQLGRLLHAVDQRAAAVRAGGGDLMVTSVHGGSSPFVVPDHAECLVELRTAPDVPGTHVVEEIQELLEADWCVRIELVLHRDGWRLDDSGPGAELARRLAEALGTGPTFSAPYWMEAPLWQSLCPTVVCGPSGGGLHATEEWVDLAQVRSFSRALIEVMSGGH